jgi:Clp amino terminal domain, pathogenicity island component
MQPIEPIPRAVDLTRPAGLACTMGRWETSRLHHAYVGPEHLLLGLLRQGDNPAARVLVAHGLDLETVRAEIDRLIAQGVLPGPPSDAELGRQQELQGACCVVPTRGLLKPGRVSNVRSRWRVRRRRPSVAGSPAPRWPTRTALAARSGRRHARR